MKLLLNMILILIGLSNFLMSILKPYHTVLKCVYLATIIVCISSIFSKGIYRYILAGIAFILIFVSYILQGVIY